jgi:ribonuclease P/MRP protein subunit POP3
LELTHSEKSASTDLVSATERVDLEPPLILSHLVYGVNAVTKRLEIQTQSTRRPTTSVPETSGQPSDTKPLKYVFVCRADVNPPLLVAHLPHLVAAYNSTNPSEYLKLIPLPQGAEISLAEALGIRRVTVLGIDVGWVDDLRLKSTSEQVSTLSASWLSKPPPSLVATHIKHIRTTAPKDMKAAKILRTQEKAAAKEKKKNQNPSSST